MHVAYAVCMPYGLLLWVCRLCTTTCMWLLGAGVRSLNFLDHLLSCGSGQGKLFFYDLRASAYLDLNPVAEQAHLSSVAAPERGCLQCGTGYLNMSDPVYLCVHSLSSHSFPCSTPPQHSLCLFQVVCVISIAANSCSLPFCLCTPPSDPPRIINLPLQCCIVLCPLLEILLLMCF